jgi:uncharacterized protein
MTNDPYLITTLEQLREQIGFPHAATAGKNLPTLDAEALKFIRRSPLIILATADAQGRLDTSPKGDDPGFVVATDERTLIIPDRPGNKLAYGHENILATGRVGLIFLAPNTAETLRVNGRAELTRDPALLEQLAARGKPAVLAVRVRVEECFFHCGKAFIRSRLWEPDTWESKQRISFGRQFAQRAGADAATADAIDQAIERDYRENL